MHIILGDACYLVKISAAKEYRRILVTYIELG